MNSVIAVLSSRCTRTTIIYTYVYIIYDIYTYVYTCCTHNNTHIHTQNCSCLLSTVVGRAVVGCWPSASLFAVDDCVADMLDFAFCPNRRLLQLTCYTHTHTITLYMCIYLLTFFYLCLHIQMQIAGRLLFLLFLFLAKCISDWLIDWLIKFKHKYKVANG